MKTQSYQESILAVFVLFLGLNAHLSTAQAQTIQPIYSFTESAEPAAALTLGPDGNFYGTTYEGGTYGEGTVFKVTTNGALTSLVSFNDANGENPFAGLILGSDGNFYGTASGGGSSDGYGTAFKVTTNGVLTALVIFNGTDGYEPYAGLAPGPDGNFYGTTLYGGSNGYGTVFQMTTNGTLTTLVNFNYTNGAGPEAALTPGPDGNFYGTTYAGGSSDNGTVFKMTTNGTLTTLYSFTAGTLDSETLLSTNSDGANPPAALTLGSDGNFYGTANEGGSYGDGTLFKVTTNGVFTMLVTFNDTNGAFPEAALTLGPDGNFYGNTYEGGSDGDGTVFKVTTNGTLTTLASFNDTDGKYPYATLTLGPDGNFYGTTIEGGPNGDGEIYRLDLPPEIIQQPTNEIVVAGSQAAFSVSLFGTAPYSYQWLSNNIPIVGATNGVLTLSNASAADDADYSIVVSNAWGSVSNSVALLTVATLQVNSIAGQNGNIILSFTSLPNATTRLWATTNLAAPADWIPIYTNTVTTTNGEWQFTDSNLYQQRYYRISMP